jgi:hypothetical protein
MKITRNMHGEMKIQILLGKSSQNKRPLGKSWLRGEHDINMNLRGTVCDSADWIELSQDKVWCRGIF